MDTSNTNKGLSRYAIALDHIAICVEDLEESIQHYTGKLGFELVNRMEVEGESTGMISAVVRAGGVVFVLLQGTSPESQISRFVSAFGAGVQHVAVSVTDLQEASAELAKNKVAMETDIIVGEGISQQFTVREPHSAVRLEFVERRGGNFNRRSVEQLFRTMEANGSY